MRGIRYFRTEQGQIVEEFRELEQRQGITPEKKAEKEPTLYDSLVTYGESDFYPYHMPGHKRKRYDDVLSKVFQIDITEIDGFDNLHCARGILKEAQEQAAELYGAEESFFLINGSTCGVLASILSVTDRQDTIVIARNCHKSVYHAAFLQELHLRYLYPGELAEYRLLDAIAPEAVEDALERYSDCKAVVITSPTYEGVIADVRRISEIVHARGKILIVDEAHGAHLGLACGMTESAVRQGADMVIHSLHKTLPSMTQTALLHVNGGRVNRMKLRNYLNILQSSSPSYVLMASMDACLSFMKEQAALCFGKLIRCRQHFMECAGTWKRIRIGNYEAVQGKGYQLKAWDICKVVISVQGSSMSGQALYETLLHEFHLQMEMAADSYALAIMTIADEEADWQRLADALHRIDGRIESVEEETPEPAMFYPPEVKMPIAEALHRRFGGSGREVLLAGAHGKVMGNFINLYPPGIPILVPGEVADEGTIIQIQRALDTGLSVQGVSDNGTVAIL